MTANTRNNFTSRYLRNRPHPLDHPAPFINGLKIQLNIRRSIKISTAIIINRHRTIKFLNIISANAHQRIMVINPRPLSVILFRNLTPHTKPFNLPAFNTLLEQSLVNVLHIKPARTRFLRTIARNDMSRFSFP